MSDYKKGDWCEIWDALYWRFIHKYQDKFVSNPRMRMMISLVNKKTSEQIDNYYKTAENFINNLYKK
jgi:deoxyribodipyrimidine photolyase-related protein